MISDERGIQDAQAFQRRCEAYLDGTLDPPWNETDALCGKHVAQACECLQKQIDAIVNAAIEYGVNDEVAAVIAHAELVLGRRTTGQFKNEEGTNG